MEWTGPKCNHNGCNNRRYRAVTEVNRGEGKKPFNNYYVQCTACKTRYKIGQLELTRVSEAT